MAVGAIVPAAAIAAAPANDDFETAAPIAAGGGTVSGTNLEATEQAAAGEPDHAATGYGPLHSVWYSWTPVADGQATIDTCGSAFNTRMAIYTGSSLSALSLVAENEDSGGPACGGTAWAELRFAATAGTTYRIVVDTSGGVDSSGAPDYYTSNTRGAINLRLTAPAGSPPPEEPATTPGTAVPSRLYRNLRIPRLIASCGDDTPKGNSHCRKGPFEFKTAASVERFRRKLEHLGITAYVTDATGVASGRAANAAQAEALRRSGTGGEITKAKIQLVYQSGNDFELDQNGRYDIDTGKEAVRIYYSYFDLAKDRKAIAEEKEDLRKEAERQAAKKGPDPPKSRCLPIAAGESNAEIARRFPKPGETPLSQAYAVLNKLGCDVVVGKTSRGRPSIETSYVKGVVGRIAKDHTIEIEVGQPGSHDFVFTVRENPADFASLASRSNIPIGTDGNLTVSNKQHNRFTVQVLERSTGRLVAGIPVDFNGQSRITDGNGDATFVAPITSSGEYHLSTEFRGLEGWRTIRAEDRGKRSFTSMAGRKIKLSSKGTYAGSDEAELNFVKSLPVVPANIGSGRVGAVTEIPKVQQSTVTTFDSSGQQFTGSHNVINVDNNSNALVGAGPGLVALGGGTQGQVGAARAVAREGTPNPLALLGAIVGGLKGAIDKSVANVRAALGPNIAAIQAVAQALGAQGSGLISDKGLGVISVGGGNLIGQAGGNLISDKGLGVISVGGGNLIGQAGGNLIGQAGGNLQIGGNVIANDGCSCMPVNGGKVISTGGGN